MCEIETKLQRFSEIVHYSELHSEGEAEVETLVDGLDSLLMGHNMGAVTIALYRAVRCQVEEWDWIGVEDEKPAEVTTIAAGAN
jgi:hypothetical protein